MLPSLKLANLWRVIRDVDLERIRASARRPFELVVTADDPAAGERVRAVIGAVPGGVHPYVRLESPEDLRTRPTVPLLVVLVSATRDLSARLRAVDEHCVVADWARITVVTSVSREADTLRVGEQPGAAIADVLGDARALVAPMVNLIDADERLAVAAALPVFRLPVADAIVDDTARANASFAAATGLAEVIPVLTAPLNLGDMVILTKNQLVMGYRIALAAGREGEPRAMIAEILGVLGGGLLFRQMARQLVGLIPVAGLLPKVVIAYAGTYAMGRALTAWALGGADVTADAVSRYTADGMDRGRVLAQELLATVRTRTPPPGSSWRRLRGWLPPRRGGVPPRQSDV